jgi:hypothetical protein
MPSDWIEVTSGEQIVEALELAGIGAPALERLLLAPDSGRYLRVEADEHSRTPGTFDIRVPGTRFYFNVTACKEFKGDIVVALASYLITHSVPVAAMAAALRKLSDNVKRLTDEEVSMIRTIIRACPGNPYETPVSEHTIRERFRGDPRAVDDLLDALESKGVIKGRRGDRLQLVY